MHELKLKLNRISHEKHAKVKEKSRTVVFVQLTQAQDSNYSNHSTSILLQNEVVETFGARLQYKHVLISSLKFVEILPLLDCRGKVSFMGF